MQNTDGSSGYSYFAFISYSRKDEHWARWLQKELEKYRLPSVLQKEDRSVPKRIHPIFRDRTDLTTGQLQTALHNELDVSKKLIVICSPNSAQSEWVNKEVVHFIEAGRVADIIPLIVGGTPNSGDEQECFPEGLRLPEDEQLLGVSVHELGRRDALLRVVAGLLDIKFDQLKRRHEQRRKRQIRIRAASLILGLIIASVGGYLAWDYYVPHTAYYADYVLRWGVPEGLIPLTQKDIESRASHYAMIRERGLVRKVIHENSAGAPVRYETNEQPDRPIISLYYYREDGRVEYVEYADPSGKVLFTMVYTSDFKAADFQQSGGDSALRTLAASTTGIDSLSQGFTADPLAAEKSDIARHIFEYDGNGFITKITYMRDRRAPILDAERIGGLEYTLDNFGRVTGTRYLNLGGQTYTASRSGVAGSRVVYDDKGNIIRIEYFDLQGNPAPNTEGWAAREIEYDEAGNPVVLTHLDGDGNKNLISLGFSVLTVGYDGRGFQNHEACFDADGAPVLCMDNYSAYAVECDAEGRRVYVAFFGIEGEPIINRQGCAFIHYEYDEYGNFTRRVMSGPDGKPVIGIEGYAEWRNEYDGHGNMTWERYFGADGASIVNNSGYAAVAMEYNEMDLCVSMTFFGADGNPCMQGDGYAALTMEYDDRGNVMRTSFFGADGAPVLTNNVYASYTYEYDEGGNRTGWACFGTDGKPILFEEGYAKLTIEYDDRGNRTGFSHYDEDGRLTMNREGYASLAAEYDEQGNLVREAFFDTAGAPAESVSYGCAAVKFDYGARGELIRMERYSADGKLTQERDGYAIAVYEYDERGNFVRWRNLDAGGEPVLSSHGFSVLEYEYNEFGEVAGYVMYDEHGAMIQ